LKIFHEKSNYKEIFNVKYYLNIGLPEFQRMTAEVRKVVRTQRFLKLILGQDTYPTTHKSCQHGTVLERVTPNCNDFPTVCNCTSLEGRNKDNALTIRGI
jgi:hypothetical protein